MDDDSVNNKLLYPNENPVLKYTRQEFSVGSDTSSNNSDIDPKFKSEWQSFPEFQAWLEPLLEDKSRAWCKACSKSFNADLKALRVHGAGKTHLRLVQKLVAGEINEIVTQPIAYNVICDRNRSYGIGLVNEVRDSPNKNTLLYVNASNSDNAIHSQNIEVRRSSVIVSTPPSGCSTSDSVYAIEVEVVDKSSVNFDSVAQSKMSEISKLPVQMAVSSSSQNDTSTAVSRADEGIHTIEEQIILGHEDLNFVLGVEDDIGALLATKRKNPELSNNFQETSPRKKTRVDHEVAIIPSVITGTKAFVSKAAPFWKCKAVVNGHITDLKLSDFAGRYLVMFFYPQDFSVLCSSEIVALSDKIMDFRTINTEVVACSTDSPYTHRAACRIARKNEGFAHVKVTLLSDPQHALSRDYGCYLPEAGHNLRASYIIDPKGILRHMSVNDIQVGRNVSELIRLVRAFQKIDNQPEMFTPPDWQPGKPLIG